MASFNTYRQKTNLYEECFDQTRETLSISRGMEHIKDYSCRLTYFVLSYRYNQQQNILLNIAGISCLVECGKLT
jgi:hypothetical protein